MTDADLVTAVAAAVAVVLGFPVDTPPSQRVTDASAAAVALVRWYLYGDLATINPLIVDPPAQPELPAPTEGPEMFLGLQALAVRIYHDPASPTGVVGGDAYTGTAIPEDILAHVRHYFTRWRRSWGVA